MKTEDYAEQSNEKVFFLYNKLTGMAPYTHEFVPGHLDSQILSGFISAMSSFMEEMTGTEQQQWKTVYGSDSILLVEVSDWMVSVLAVTRETQEHRSKLRRIVREYEQAFEHLKTAEGIEGGIFHEFDRYVQRVFMEDRLNERTLILRGDDCVDLYMSKQEGTKESNLFKLLSNTSDGQTISEYTEESGMESSLARNLISEAVWKNFLYLHFIPEDQDILELTTGASSVLFSNDNSLELPDLSLTVITALDGRKPLHMFLAGLSHGKRERLIIDLGNLCNQGYLSRIPIEQGFLLLNECILTGFYQSIQEELNQEQANSLFHRVRENTAKAHSWAGRVALQSDGRVITIFESTVTPRDLDMIVDSLDAFIAESINAISKSIGKIRAKKLLQHCQKRCNDAWRSYLEESLL